MKLILLYTVVTLLAVGINAAILPEPQHATNSSNRQIAKLQKAEDVKEGLTAAAEYFKAPQASKQNLKTEIKERLASAAEYFKASDASELRSNITILAQERLAAAAEYLKAPEFSEHLSGTKVENAHDVAPEYFRAPESPRHNTRTDRTAESLAATAEYFRTPESPRHNTKIDRTIKSNAAAAKHFRASDYYSKRRKYLVTHGRPMFRPTEKYDRRRFVRLG